LCPKDDEGLEREEKGEENVAGELTGHAVS
jgi:hypothetical protein